MRTIDKNLADWYRKATPKHRKHGRAWYQDAHRFARGLSRATGLDFPRVVGVIAALSPRCAWSENVTAALTLVRTGRLPKGTPVLPLNVIKAREIMAGKPPLSVLKGSKVLAFYDNILSPKTSQHVTIDIHAARAAYNKASLTKTEESRVFRVQGNLELQQAYKRTAKRLNLRPHKLQAIIWLAVRDSLRKPKDPQLHLFYKEVSEDV